MNIERLRQRLQQSGHCALICFPGRNCDCKLIAALKIDFPRQRDVATLRGMEFPVHFEMIHQILPSIAGTDKSDGSPQKPSAASHDEMNIFALGMEQSVAADFGTPAGVTRA